MQIVILKNNTSRVLSFEGKDLQVGEQLNVAPNWQQDWRFSTTLFKLVADNDIIVSDGEKDYSSAEGWKWFLGNGELPRSEVGNKIWVHSSAKPVIEGKSFYSVWVGSGDDEDNHIMGDGPLLTIHCTPGTPVGRVDMKFDYAVSGDVYIHEGFMMWENATLGDYVNAHVMAEGTHLQQVMNLDLVVDGQGFISYSHLGPGTGTHGFASAPYLLNRSFSHDGDWDYDPINSLRPNFTKTGNYKMSIYEQVVHRIMHKLPVLGTNCNPARLVSEDSMKMPHGYFLRLECHNNSNTEWKAAFLITVYKERTVNP
jgi:hypothetical protein